ncbi:MAG TPA: GNAT family N-acetyltransferase [Thiopseudomonas sp.]|nr:GNAT family N-acetyltransferase [Thiopseudomonas sp.]
MNTTGYAIRHLGKSDLLAAAEICAKAMNDNPIHIKVFGSDPALRQRRLQRFFSGMLAYVERKGSLYGSFSDETMIGVLGMLPPGHCKPSFGDILRLLPTLLTSNSPIGTIRLAIWLSRWAKIDPATPHWHLGPLSVDPAWQGQGIGTQLIEYAYSICTGAELYLETDKLSNVELYKKFGFSILDTPSILATPSWLMTAPARSEKTEK